jgi:hypothetical protein
MAERVKLHGERADRFRELKDRLAEELGYQPSNAEAMGLIMSEFPDADYPPARR